MCGIITIVKRNDDGLSTASTILGMLKSQIHRGKEGFGYVAFNDAIDGYVRRETQAEIERPLERATSRSIMFHHRLPTSTPNFADCTHPIKVSHKELPHDYYVIHNGMISNHSLLHDKHVELGYKYQTTIKTTVQTQNNSRVMEKWNDSEALAIDLARFIEAKQDKIESRGSIAFIALQVNKKNNKVLRVFFGRNTNPLTIKITKDLLVLRSEGEELDIESNMLYALDMKTWKVEQSETPIGEVMSVVYNQANNWGAGWSQEDEDYYSSHRTTHKGNDVGEQMIINSFVNTQLRAIDEKLDILAEQLSILYDAKEYYRDSGNVALMEENETEILKLEADQDELEAEREELLDETLGEAGLVAH